MTVCRKALQHAAHQKSQRPCCGRFLAFSRYGYFVSSFCGEIGSQSQFLGRFLGRFRALARHKKWRKCFYSIDIASQ